MYEFIYIYIYIYICCIEASEINKMYDQYNPVSHMNAWFDNLVWNSLEFNK